MSEANEGFLSEWIPFNGSTKLIHHSPQIKAFTDFSKSFSVLMAV